MFVRDRMTKNPYTIPSSTTIADAVALFREKGFRRFPVVDNGKLVGILTKEDIQTVSPTKATSLSIFEVNYFLSKITIKEAMTKKVITIEAV
jgi:acetoin utilization protein AcuB